MKQVKRWTALAVSLTALAALMIPSVAGAAKLEQPKGTLVPNGTEVILTSSNLVEAGVNGITLECQKAELRGVLTTNNGKEVKVVGNEEFVAAEHCANQLGEVDQTLQLTGLFATSSPVSGGGGGSVGFVTGWKGLCEMATESSSLTWNGTSQVHMVAWVNGACGRYQDTGDFTLTNSSGQELILTT